VSTRPLVNLAAARAVRVVRANHFMCKRKV
jgi:hypothetical protein